MLAGHSAHVLTAYIIRAYVDCHTAYEEVIRAYGVCIRAYVTRSLLIRSLPFTLGASTRAAQPSRSLLLALMRRLEHVGSLTRLYSHILSPFPRTRRVRGSLLDSAVHVLQYTGTLSQCGVKLKLSKLRVPEHLFGTLAVLWGLPAFTR